MDKNKVKAFAIWARSNLIEKIKDRAYKIGIEDNRIRDIEEVQGGFKVVGGEEILNILPNHRKALIKEIESKSLDEVVEEVAYTWFNRFIGLRYMEVNDYLPIGIRIISSEIQGKTEPDILFRVGEVIRELRLDSDLVYKLLDSGKNSDRESLYKYILIRQCNELGNIIPGLFEKTADYTELLFPDNLLEEGSMLRKMCSDIDEEDWKDEVEIIGWMYQYYISEKKDMVFDNLKKNIKITKENIPAATQLFTPKWIVKYLVENSLGTIWIQGHEDENLKTELKYYLEEGIQDSEINDILGSIKLDRKNVYPEDIKVLDPCMGSGHILLYTFDVLYKIYKSAAYPEREIPRRILESNIFGLDIDLRATQIGAFCLVMKARSYNRRFFREVEKKPLKLNIESVEESNGITYEIIEYFAKEDEEIRGDLSYLVNAFRDGKEFGSILRVEKVNFQTLKERLEEINEENNLVFSDYRQILLNKLPKLINQGEIMSNKYEVCITNPPYMGLRGANDTLAKYLVNNYPLSKHDLFSVYMEVCKNFLKKDGIYAMVNQHSWMFLSSFLELRGKLLEESTFISMIHLGSRVFEDNVGTIVQNVAFINQNSEISKYKTRIVDLTKEITASEKKIKIKSACDGMEKDRIYDIWLKKLMTIPTKPFAYWVNDNVLKLFSNLDKFENIAKPRQGMATSDNKRFLRDWYEVDINEINFSAGDKEEALLSKKKWFPYNKGGEFRKWFGNNKFVINWENNGAEVKDYAAKLYKSYSRTIKNEEFYFKSGLTYTFISEDMGVRYSPQGFIFDVAGSSIFFDDKDIEKVVLALLCSKVANMFLDIMNPTYNIQVGDLKNIPIHEGIFKEEIKSIIDEIVEENIAISEEEWNDFEISWNFRTHPLMRGLREDGFNDVTIESKFRHCEKENIKIIERLKNNEEKLNKIFIDIYGLSEELTPDVSYNDITLRRVGVEREVKSLISFAVGCIMGRYSTDIDGLVYGGGNFQNKWDFENHKVKKVVVDSKGKVTDDRWVNSSFMPKLDNIIPITEEKYFSEDLMTKFVEFLKGVYGNNTLEENLNFIANILGKKDSETSRQSIRRYLFKGFYKDHVKVYGKKPIYWLFDSGKNDGFKALVYAHRYDNLTIATLRTKYVHLIQRKYEGELSRLELIKDSQEYSAKERATARKKSDKIKRQIEELIEYDEIVAYMANEKMSINLEEGIRENYDKLQNIKIMKKSGKEAKMNLLYKI
ncbi:BREX-1 system adenine-specific DNA-methyltransferase PglX [uncultured Clostridium sp.]|uniref:BREX-1 system adenine-specific DNA-methyltransferase PglX n=1 Tax=uncultured Clostridium sp. TaxID=59620 RepID=UPI003217052B